MSFIHKTRGCWPSSLCSKPSNFSHSSTAPTGQSLTAMKLHQAASKIPNGKSRKKMLCPFRPPKEPYLFHWHHGHFRGTPTDNSEPLDKSGSGEQKAGLQSTVSTAFLKGCSSSETAWGFRGHTSKSCRQLRRCHKTSVNGHFLCVWPFFPAPGNSEALGKCLRHLGIMPALHSYHMSGELDSSLWLSTKKGWSCCCCCCCCVSMCASPLFTRVMML